MKDDLQTSSEPRKPDAASGLPAREGGAGVGASTRRRWFFRLLAVGFALAPLLLLELILRVSGYGHPTSFFVPGKVSGKTVLMENTWFGLSYFRPAQARSPSPLVLPNPKPPGVCRIFLFGESAAMGDPRPAYGMGRCLEALLRARFPERQFEVVCVGMTAINSHGLLPIARECARYQGDLWIVYTGHNEFVGPFGANTVFGPTAPPGWMVRAYLALQRTRTGQMLVALARRWDRRGNTAASWGGMTVFLDQQVSPADPRKARVYTTFGQNLEDMVRLAVRAGVPVVLCSAASNLKDCAPFASVHAPALQRPNEAEWERQFQLGLKYLQRGDSAQALACYRAAATLSPRYAEGQFRLGQCWLGLTNAEAAALAFRHARDSDALIFRASTAINRLIREVAQHYAQRRVTFLDTEASLASFSQSKIAGDESFLEHVHLNFEGNYQVARALAEATVAALSRQLNRTSHNAAWQDAAGCARDLALTDWGRLTVLQDIERRVSDAPFTNQADHAASFRNLETRLAECRARLRTDAVATAHLTYQQAIQKRPRDPWLHQNYAEFLAAIGDFAQAADQMRRVCDLWPQHFAPQLQLGRLLARQKRFPEAAQAFAAALAVRPGSSEIEVELGQLAALEGKPQEALRHYGLAQKARPDEARIFLLQAQVLETLKHRGEAIQCLRKALELRPPYWEAHYLLGLTLAVGGRIPDAQHEFEEVVRLQPNHAAAHLHLGIALARQQRFEEAATHFQTTLRLDPDNAQARQFLQGAERMRKGAGTSGPPSR